MNILVCFPTRYCGNVEMENIFLACYDGQWTLGAQSTCYASDERKNWVEKKHT
jgi:hypothetical protein